jgi:hypothetical protein
VKKLKIDVVILVVLFFLTGALVGAIQLYFNYAKYDDKYRATAMITSIREDEKGKIATLVYTPNTGVVETIAKYVDDPLERGDETYVFYDKDNVRDIYITTSTTLPLSYYIQLQASKILIIAIFVVIMYITTAILF